MLKKLQRKDTCLFADAKHAANINSIVHPRVRADFSQWLLSHENEEIVGLECAILYESGFDDMTDFVVMVYAPESLRIERAMKRDGATRQQVKARIDAQMSDEEKCEKASFFLPSNTKSRISTTSSLFG